MIDDSRRVKSALEVIQMSIEGKRGNPIEWNLAWRDALRRIRPDDVLKSCRELGFDGSDSEKREAKIVARIVRRAREFVKQIEEVERDVADLYPADLARRRLDTELGWDRKPDDTMVTRLDRACMIARVRNPDPRKVRHDAHTIIRARFSDLEASEAD